jgi:hypothetical protein
VAEPNGKCVIASGALHFQYRMPPYQAWESMSLRKVIARRESFRLLSLKHIASVPTGSCLRCSCFSHDRAAKYNLRPLRPVQRKINWANRTGQARTLSDRPARPNAPSMPASSTAAPMTRYAFGKPTVFASRPNNAGPSTVPI